MLYNESTVREARVVKKKMLSGKGKYEVGDSSLSSVGWKMAQHSLLKYDQKNESSVYVLSEISDKLSFKRMPHMTN